LWGFKIPLKKSPNTLSLKKEEGSIKGSGGPLFFLKPPWEKLSFQREGRASNWGATNKKNLLFWGRERDPKFSPYKETGRG